MRKIYHYFLFFIFIFCLYSEDCFSVEVFGRVTDNNGTPLSGVKVQFASAYTSARFEEITDAFGNYAIEVVTSAKDPDHAATALYCYPNPFNRQTVVSFTMTRQQDVELAIYDIMGRKIRVIANRQFAEGNNQLIWDGLTANGEPAAPGLYVCSLLTKAGRETVKMIVMGGYNVAMPVEREEPAVQKAGNNTFSLYTAYISGNDFQTHIVSKIDLSQKTEKNFKINKLTWVPFSTTENYLSYYDGDQYIPFFTKGVNLGGAIPGAWPGQMAVTSEQYARWFRMITDAGFNTIRIYTLHYPRFYDEFARYNNNNPDKPLYLLHGVWLPEEYDNVSGELYDLHAHTIGFEQSCRDAVDCIHGNNTIGHRYGEAYGEYKTDISKWIIGWIIGREIFAEEVETTHINHVGETNYKGSHLSLQTMSTPAEVWAVNRMDNMIKYERTHYQTERPIAFSSWLTLDPLDHPSEVYSYTEDGEPIDLNKVNLTDAPAGHFISYHAYPYYPRFIDNEYSAIDEMGQNPYLGYLQDLRAYYTNYPVLITEFGMPTSYGVAQFSTSGMHHGGVTEEQQGNYIMRIFKNLYDSDYGGGVNFSWMDEWFKVTWITNPMALGNRRHVWHNICNPENNFGLLRFDPNPKYFDKRQKDNFSSGKISTTEVSHDFVSLNMDATLRSSFNKGDTLWVAFDTYKRDLGESTLPNGRNVLKNRAEFLLRITSDSANLFVMKEYDLVGLVFQTCPTESFCSKKTDGAPWMPVRWQTDEENTMNYLGRLHMYQGNGTPDREHAVHISSNKISIRIPWILLHFSDPSNSQVINDNVNMDNCLNLRRCGGNYLLTTRTDGVVMTLIYNNENPVATKNYTWPDWDINKMEVLDESMYVETEKKSLSIIREGLRNNPFHPK